VTPFLEAAIREMLDDADPSTGCAACGFTWTADAAPLLDHVAGAGGRFGALLAGRDASRKPDAETWSPSAYVWHVGDVTRAWSERLHALANDPAARWAGFDPDELGRARAYDQLPAVTGPWALDRATDAFAQVLAWLDLDDGFDHPEWGHGTVADAVRWVAHELAHHERDVRRGLDPS
jgi:hypothetical protein